MPNADGTITFRFDNDTAAAAAAAAAAQPVASASSASGSAGGANGTGTGNGDRSSSGSSGSREAVAAAGSGAADADADMITAEHAGSTFPTAATVPLPPPLAVSSSPSAAASTAAGPEVRSADAPTPPTPPTPGSTSARVPITILDERDHSMREGRPMIPSVDLPALADVLFGSPGVRPELQALFKLADQVCTSVGRA